MSTRSDEAYAILEQIFENFPNVRAADIPGIDLYMDQVTTFLQDSLQSISRDPEEDKFLTKTMINNYVKNKVLPPPVKKKYSRDQMMMLIIIYYMKSFLSINDIRSITSPVIEYCSPGAFADKKREATEKRRENADRKRDAADRKRGQDEQHAAQNTRAAAHDRDGTGPDGMEFSRLYDRIMTDIEEMLPKIHEEIMEQINLAGKEFEEIDREDRVILQHFSLICRLSAEVYVRKLLIEKLLDEYPV